MLYQRGIRGGAVHGARASRWLLAFSVAALMLASAIAAAPAGAAAKPARLRVACTHPVLGVLRLARSESDCRRRERPVRFDGRRAVRLCVSVVRHEEHEEGRETGFEPDGDEPGILRKVASAAACRRVGRMRLPRNHFVTLPDDKRLALCATRRRRILRTSHCGRGDVRLYLPARPSKHPPKPPANRPPTAMPDAAQTTKRHGVAIPVLANDRDPENDALFVASLGTAGTKGHVSIGAEGSVLYDPAGAYDRLKSGQTATDHFTYRATDGSRESNVASVTVTISGSDAAPSARDDSASTDESHAVAVAVLANDTDDDGDALHVASVDATGTQGEVTIGSDGTVTYDPNGKFASLRPGESATDTFTYKANDGGADSNPATVTVTVIGVNDAPVLSGVEDTSLAYDTGSAAQPVSSTIEVADADGVELRGATVAITTGYEPGLDALTFSDQNGITGTFDTVTGVMSLSGDSSLANYQAALRDVRYGTLDPTPSGHRTVSFRVNDGAGPNPFAPDSNTVARDVDVTHVNHAPVAQDDTASTSEASPVSIPVLDNDTDSDHDPLTVASVTDPAKGTVTMSADGQSVTFDPHGQFTTLAPGDSVEESFTYAANDGTADSNAATVTVTITGANDAPVLADVEGQALDYDTGSPAAPISSTVTVSDDDNAKLAGAKVWISSNYAPGRDSLSFEDQNGIMGEWDPSTGTMTLTGTSLLANYQTALRDVRYSADDPTPSGSRTVSFQANDGAGAVPDVADGNVVTRDITLTHVNHAPVAEDDTAATDQNAAMDVDVLANDTDSDEDPLHVATGSALSDNGASVSVNDDGTVHYDPGHAFDDLAAGDLAQDAFTYKADDGTADSGPATVTVTITGTNDAPALDHVEGDALAYDTGSGGAAASDTITASDVDSMELASATVSISSGYAKDNDDLSFSDQNGITHAWDPASGTLTLTGPSSVANFQAALRSVQFRADGSAPAGTRTISFQVSDDATPHASSNTVSRDIEVSHVNRAPVANDDSASTAQNTATDVDVLANDTDPDGDSPLHVASLDTAGTVGTVSINANDTVRYDSGHAYDALPQGATAQDTFTYKAADPGAARSSPATVTVTISCKNDAPVLDHVEGSALAYDSGSGPSSVSDTITASDVDSGDLDTATVWISSGYAKGNDQLSFSDQNGITHGWDPASGTLTLTGPALVAHFQAALRSVDFSADGSAPGGTRTISFQVDDGEAANHASGVVTRDIEVTHVNRAPVAKDDSASTAQNTAIDVPVLDNDNDPDGDSPLHVDSVGTTGTAGAVSANTDGTVHYDPGHAFDHLAAGATAPDTFTYKAADPGNAKSSPATVTVTITGTNDAPVLDDVEGSALAYGKGSGGASVSDAVTVSDVDSGNLASASVSIGSGYAQGHDQLTFADQNNITHGWDPASGTLTLTGPSSVANFQAALRSVQFSADDTAPTGTRTISFGVDDGAAASNPVARDVDVSAVNKAPIAVTDTFGSSTDPVTVGNTALSVGTTSSGPNFHIDSRSVLDNDSDPDGPHANLTATAPSTSASGAKVDMHADGTFTYVPPQGFTGKDTFTYTVHDNDALAKTADGTVEISVGGLRVWYVDRTTATNGDGRSDSPFNGLAQLNGSSANVDGPGDTIFLYNPASQPCGYTGGLALAANQQLIGQPQGLLVDPAGATPATSLVAAGGANPEVCNAAGDAIRLADDVTIQHVDTGTSSGRGVSGVAITNATIDPGTTISGAAGGALALSAPAAGTISIGSTITSNAGTAVSIANRSGGTTTLSGDVTASNGPGVVLDSNAGATLNLTGKLTLATGGSAGFTATNGGTVTAAQGATTSSTITSGNATALTVRNTTIGPEGLHFRSVSSNGASQGIVLDTTDSSGGLTVTGTGSPCTAGTGGSVQGSLPGPADDVTSTPAGTGIVLNQTGDVSLSCMHVQNFSNYGLHGVDVKTLSLDRSVVDGPTGSVYREAALFISGGADRAVTMDVGGNTVQGAKGHAVQIAKTPGPASLSGTFDGNTIGAPGVANSGSLEGSGVWLEQQGRGAMSVDIKNNSVSQYNNYGISLQAGIGTVESGQLNATVSGNTVSNPGSNVPTIKYQGFHINSGVTPGDAFQTCVKIGAGNAIAGSGRNAGGDFRVRQRQDTTVKLPGYNGGSGLYDTAAVQSFLQQQFPGAGGTVVSDGTGGGFVGGTSCP